MYWYVLFVKTGREQKVEQFLKKRLDTDTFSPFIPLAESLFKVSGTLKKELRPLFPGYVFVESEAAEQEFIECIREPIYDSNDIIYILKYSDTEIAMRESEKQMLLNLCHEDHYIKSSSGVIIGDKIHIISGALKGLESIVKKVNRHKRQAWVEIEFMGALRMVNVGLEIVSKISDV